MSQYESAPHLGRMLADVTRRLSQLEKDSTGTSVAAASARWHHVGNVGEPAFGFGWDDDAGQLPPRFIRTGGFVHLAGAAKKTGTEGGPVLFTLPERYRPSITAYLPAHTMLNTVTGHTMLIVSASSGAVSVHVGDFQNGLVPQNTFVFLAVPPYSLHG